MVIEILSNQLNGVLLLKSKVFGDARGFFQESFNRRDFETATGLNVDFVQDNHSRSVQGVLRGLHFQIEKPQGKLVRVVSGEVLDVAVDIRPRSPTCGEWVAHRLSAENHLQMWIPPGFAHGFLVTSEYAEFLYKTTTYWNATDDRCVLWNDPALAIAWPLNGAPQLSAKDQRGVAFEKADVYA